MHEDAEDDAMLVLQHDKNGRDIVPVQHCGHFVVV